MLLDLLLVLGLLNLELLSKLVNLLFLLVENFVLLLLAALSIFLAKILLNFSDILLICFNHLLHLNDFLVKLLDLCVILLDSILEPLSSLWKGQVHLVGLKLQIFLLLGEHGSLLLEMLSALLKGILAKSGLSLSESSVDLLELVPRVVDILREHIILLLQLLILVSLLWVQVVQPTLILEVDVLDLTLVGLNLGLHISLLSEKVVEMRSLLIILSLDMHEESLNIFWLSVTSILVKRQIVVG